MPNNIPLYPSHAQRWVKCAGSATLEPQFPQDQSEEATEGIAAHDVAIGYVMLGVLPAPGESAANGRTIDQAMIDGATLFNDHVMERVLDPISLAPHLEETYEPAVLGFGKRYTPDCWIYQPMAGTLDVWEYKYGHAHVEVFENWQLLIYAIELLAHLERTMGHSIELRTQIRLHIIQPRSYHREGPCRSWNIIPGGLRAYANIIAHAIDRARMPNPSVTAGLQCTSCNAVAACEAAQDFALIAADRSRAATPFQLKPIEASRELVWLRTLRKILEAREAGLEAQVIGDLRAGKFIPDWALATTQPHLKWRVPVEEVIGLGELFDVDLREPASVITPAAARKAGIDETVINEYAYRPVGALKLTRVDASVTRKIFSNQPE